MVKSRFDQPKVRTVVHLAQNGLIHVKMVDVEYPRVITSKVNLFSRPDQEKRIIGPASLLHMGQFLQGEKNGRLMSFFLKEEPPCDQT